MTRGEQERLVERYLDGGMSSVEEEEFFIQVAVDNDLRRTLKAHRIVDSAIRKHRESGHQHHDIVRSRLVNALGTEAHAGTAAGIATTAPERLAENTVTISRIMFNAVVSSVAIAALAVGTFVVAPLINGAANETASSAHRPEANARSVEGAPTAAAAFTGGALRSTPTNGGPAIDGSNGTAPRTTQSAASPGSRNGTARVQRQATAARSTERTIPAEPPARSSRVSVRQSNVQMHLRVEDDKKKSSEGNK